MFKKKDKTKPLAPPSGMKWVIYRQAHSDGIFPVFTLGLFYANEVVDEWGSMMRAGATGRARAECNFTHREQIRRSSKYALRDYYDQLAAEENARSMLRELKGKEPW